MYGKTGSFLLINGAHSPALDVFFKYCTYLGDGMIYVPLLAYCLFFNRSFIIPVVLGIIICLVLTHFFKKIVFPHMLRPISLQAQHIAVHKVAGVRMLRIHSFPSGHTATAFSTALLLVTVLRDKAWAYILPVLTAFLVGYSRVYLAQHFVTDVLGGMVIGALTAWLALWLHPRLLNALPQALQLRLKEQPVS